jgi:hypothetical protein
MLLSIGPDLWLAEGPVLVAAAGFHYPTRMVIIRLANGGLILWSPIALTPALKSAVDALGPVAHLIGPNNLHHMALGDWQAAYPAAQLHAAPRLAAKRPDLRVDATLGPTLPPGWAGEVDQVVIENRITTEVVFYHRASRTVIFTDLLQQLPPGWFKGWRAWVAKLDLMVADQPSVPRKFRMGFANRAALRASLTRILAWQPERLIFAHGPVIEREAAAVLARAFAWVKA